MFDRLKRLLGGKVLADENRHDLGAEVVVTRSAGSEGRPTNDSYFATMALMQEAISKREFERAAHLVRENLHQIPNWVKDWRLEYGKFDIRSIPALDQGGTILAVVADDDGLAEMRQIVESIPDLKPWADEVTRHAQDRQMFKAIVDAVTAHPNCLQTDIKNLISADNGHRVANLI